jgi:hypothetical protein
MPRFGVEVDSVRAPVGAQINRADLFPRFHVDDRVFDDFKIDPDKLRPIGRMGGSTYMRATDRFEMPRPRS